MSGVLREEEEKDGMQGSGLELAETEDAFTSGPIAAVGTVSRGHLYL